MTTLRKGLAFLCAILFIVTALLGQVFFNLERKGFSPETYQQAFANDQFYERIPGILADSVMQSGIQGLPVTMNGLTRDNWENFFRDLLPAPILKSMGDQALGSMFAYLNNQGDTAVISLAPLKERMASEPGTQAVVNLMRTQPVCTLADIARITSGLLSQGVLNLCSPPEEMMPLVIPLIQGQLQVTSAAIPEQVTLAQAEPAGGRPDARGRLQIARLGMRLSPLVPLFFLLLMTVLAVRSLHDLLVWWGAPFLITGVFGAVSAALGAPLAGFILTQFLVSRMPAFLPSALWANSGQLASAIVEQMLRPTLLQGIVLTLLGGLMLAAAFILHLVRREPAV